MLKKIKIGIQNGVSRVLGIEKLGSKVFLNNRLVIANLRFLQLAISLTREQGDSAESRIREFWSLLTPLSLEDFELKRFGPDGDSGYVLVDELDAISEVLSLGVGDNNDIDYFFASSAGKTVFAYDHTVSEVPRSHRLIHFRQQGVGHGPNMLSLNQILANEPISASALMLCDIEGAEFSPEFIEGVSFSMFRQVSIELHNLDNLLLSGRGAEILELVGRLAETHQSVHVHINNFDPLCYFRQLPLPNTLEVTLVRRKDYAFGKPLHAFPLAIDQPNTPSLPDYGWNLPGDIELDR